MVRTPKRHGSAPTGGGLRARVRGRWRQRDPVGVRTSDGIRLHVEQDGEPGAPLTLVMVHGFTASLHEFDRQREALRGRCRIVLYDQRGHGRSGWRRGRHATLDQLGADLGAVLDAHAPRGPVVLLGHSMGGMTVMSLARQRPELFGPRVAGVFLLATSAGDLANTGPLGLLVKLLARLHLLRLWLLWLRLWAPLLERVRRRGTALGRRFIEHYLFGTTDVTPERVDEVQALLEQTPLTVSAAFYPLLFALDEVAALQVLRPVPVTILVGSDDRLTPAGHSRKMAQELPQAELVVVPGAGHSVNITRPELVNAEIAGLLDRVQERPGLAAG